MAENKSAGCGKWFAGIAASVIGGLIFWSLTHPGGPLNQPTPVPPPPEPTQPPPHAPLLDGNGFQLYEERLKLIELNPGAEETLNIMEIWLVPLVEPPSCASGFVVMSWMVRNPYPTGGDELHIRHPIHSADGTTEEIGFGQSGSITVGYCDEVTFSNYSTQTYKVEIRYASGKSN